MPFLGNLCPNVWRSETLAAIPRASPARRTRKATPNFHALALAAAWTLGAIFAASLALNAHADSQPSARAVERDPMQQAAQLTRLATRSVLVGVARAGERLVAVGERGHVLISDDNGNNWKQVASPVSVTLTAVHFSDEKNGWAVGHSGIILRSGDGGQSWSKQLDGLQANQLMLAAARASGNAEWLERAENFAKDGADKPFLAVHFSDGMRGLAVGAYGLAFATSDGGHQWKPVFDLAPEGDERHLYVIHESRKALYVGGEQGLLLRRPLGDVAFHKLGNPFRNTVFELDSLPDGALLAGGLGGKLYRSEDEGQQWAEVSVPSKAALTASVVGKEGVVLANEAGQFLFSADSGRSFKSINLSHPFPVSDLTAAADGQWVMVGPRGVLAVKAPNLQKN